jgi:hypothetical protein
VLRRRRVKDDVGLVLLEDSARALRVADIHQFALRRPAPARAPA